MFSNIYEDPNVTMNVKYSQQVREDRGQKVERLVDIYHMDNDRHDPIQNRGAQTQKHCRPVQRNCSEAAALVLALLCLLLVAGVTVLLKLYFSVTVEKEWLQVKNEELQASYNSLSNSLCQGNLSVWKRFQSSCYYTSSEMKTWTESRRDCQERGADLVIVNGKEENDFIKKLNEEEAWIGLKPVRDNQEWNLERQWTWKWVDDTTPTYQAWRVEQTQKPENENASTAYINLRGQWMQIINGYKRWICERPIH